MKSTKYILAISAAVMLGCAASHACGPYLPDDPRKIRMFRVCTPELQQQWQTSRRLQDYEKEENCRLWQSITSDTIPLKDIENAVYGSSLKDLEALPQGVLSANKFARWLSDPQHREDLDYVLVAKEIEETRNFMNDPWYYPYDGDEEHQRLAQLLEKCEAYPGSRHAARYALQTVRLYFAQSNFQGCIDLWEQTVGQQPQDIVTDMVASYVGGAYLRQGNREKAIELYTRCQDIGSLIYMKAWPIRDEGSPYVDARVAEMEAIFNRFPNSPLLTSMLQGYVKDHEDYILEHLGDSDCEEDWMPDLSDTYAYESEFYDELKRFAMHAAASDKCEQKGMWNYAVAYLYYIEGDKAKAKQFLSRAEATEATPLVKESIKAMRFLVDAESATNSPAYLAKLHASMQWLDTKMQEDVKLYSGNGWQYRNKLNWSVYYWQDVARKVLLGEVCPRIEASGDVVLALQLANYATNRIHQIAPLFETYRDDDNYKSVVPMDGYRQSLTDINDFDYSNQFFDLIIGVSADDAARYAERIAKPQTEFDKFLNERGYIDTDYIYDIVGTLYMREMNYPKAVEWLSRVSESYQARTNLAKEGYFKLDPFKCQLDKKHYIANPSDYKMRFAQQMVMLEGMMGADIEANRKANAKVRYALGLRNSFGRCWYLTQYGYSIAYEVDDDYMDWEWHTSADREGFKDNQYAQRAYAIVDRLMDEAVGEFTDPEQAARAQLEMLNFHTVVTSYPDTRAAAYVRGRCDRYLDYAMQRQ